MCVTMNCMKERPRYASLSSRLDILDAWGAGWDPIFLPLCTGVQVGVGDTGLSHQGGGAHHWNMWDVPQCLVIYLLVFSSPTYPTPFSHSLGVLRSTYSSLSILQSFGQHLLPPGLAVGVSSIQRLIRHFLYSTCIPISGCSCMQWEACTSRSRLGRVLQIGVSQTTGWNRVGLHIHGSLIDRY